MESSAPVTSPRHGRSWSAVMALLATISLAACGLSGEDLFGGRTTPSEGQGGAGSGGAPTGSGGDPAAEAASSTAESAASTAQGTAQSVSSAAQTVASSAQASSSSGDPGGVVVWCAGAPCQGGEVCCFHLQDPNLDNCGSAGQCGGGFMEISCSGPGDCPGQVCCGEWQNFYTDISCQPSCNAPDVTLCTGDPGACNGGQFCDASGSLGAGYDVCKN